VQKPINEYKRCKRAYKRIVGVHRQIVIAGGEVAVVDPCRGAVYINGICVVADETTAYVNTVSCWVYYNA
jgi:hypothetical protein